ncbi:MAG: hypothetical protein LQ350_008325 [Teloschistes chrysophthalmus]|nr:MAG: hypothetical protein LQ350_008325 [Niorma chrysophthalma]
MSKPLIRATATPFMINVNIRIVRWAKARVLIITPYTRGPMGAPMVFRCPATMNKPIPFHQHITTTTTHRPVVAPVKADRIAGRILDELSAISHEAEVINNRLDRMERAILQRRLSPVTSSTNKRGNGHLIESQQNQETKVKKLRKKPDPRHVPEVTRETRAMDSSQGPHGSLGPGTSMPIWKGEVGGQGRIATSDYGMKGCLTEEVDSSGANEIFTALFYGDREWENFVKFHS